MTKTLASLGFASLILATTIARPASACEAGDEACPIALQMRPGAVSVSARGAVAEKRPSVSYRFEARKGQTLLVHIEGPAIKDQLPLTVPAGADPGDGLFQDQPYRLPASGTYSFEIFANTMAEGAFGPFTMTVTIK